MLRRKIPIFEVILGLYFLLQTILPAQFSRSSSLVGFILLSFTKYHYEGFRIAYIIFLLIQLVLLIHKSIYLTLPIAILVFFTIYYFPIYRYPTPTGKYRVGYRMIKVQGPKEATTVGVYYPTNQKSGDVKYSPSHKSWERFADIMRLYADSQKKFLIPKIVFKLVLSFLEHQYLGVNKNVPIAKIEGNKKGYPVVLFSHGHSANIHIYSIMLKEWASQGFVIFSVDHEEEIHMDITGFKGFQDYLVVRNKQLSVRKELLKSILDKICDAKFVQDLFEDSSVTLNYEKLVVSGHSFGALAAPELAVEDRRITGGMILLDPWFECANFDVSFKEVNLPLLSIRSDEYDKQTEVKTKIMQHVEKSNKDQGEVISGIVEKASHNAVTDLSVMMPREMAALGDASSFKMVEDHLRTYFTLTRTFLKSVVEYKKNEKISLKTVVMEKYKKELEEMGKKDMFTMD